MNEKPNLKNEERVELQGALNEFRQALEDEIRKIKSSGLSSTLLFGGRKVESKNAEFWYRFFVEYAPSLPADTPCKLIVGQDQFDVTVISFEENSIIVSSKFPLPDTIGKARLENGATVLMERLIQRIEENAKKENPVGNLIIHANADKAFESKKFIYDDITNYPRNNENQNQAIALALTCSPAFIWGPPGTGKTEVIGQIIYELYKRERSVLVVSHTNIAVDGAILKAYNALENKSAILRIGTPVRDLPDALLLPAHVATLGKELYKQKTVLENEQYNNNQRLSIINPQIAKNKWSISNQLSIIRNEMDVIEWLENQIKEALQEYAKLCEEIEKEEDLHPEYRKRFALEKDYKNKSKALRLLCEKLECAEKTASEAPSHIIHAQDEVKKHIHHLELKQQESNLMSEQFIRTEYSKASARKIELVFQINSLNNEMKMIQQTITDYNNKSSVAKFLYGKATISNAQTRLTDISARLPQLNDQLKLYTKLENKYKLRLEELLLLKEQISSVLPSRTKEYWEQQINELTIKLASAEKEIPLLLTDKITLSSEVEGLNKTLDIANKTYSIIDSLRSQSQAVKSKLHSLNEEFDVKRNLCSTRLDQERLLCAAFSYSMKSEDNESKYNELSSLLAAVKFELKSINIAELEVEKTQLEKQLTGIAHQLNEINQKILELERQVILKAPIIGTTLTKSYLSDTLRERSFDTVILDEASMASIPALWCATCLASTSVVIVGDFLQLPPIVMADTDIAQKWLGTDIFSCNEIPSRLKDGHIENLVMLDHQYRMESKIAELANIYYRDYGGLKSNDDLEDRKNNRDKFYSRYSDSFKNNCVHLIDTESLHAWVTGVPQGKGHSRLNCFSAAVDVDLAFKCLENKLADYNGADKLPKEASVLIIAPYKPHVARINQLIDLEYKNRGFKENLNLIKAGTIHSFQGSEADIVIFDLVVDEPHWKANLFINTEEANGDLRKMFAVAITRARFQLFIVGNFSYCQKRARNNALANLLDAMITKKHFERIDAKQLLPDIVFTKQDNFNYISPLADQQILCREETFDEYFMIDIRSFSKRLIIFSPFISENRLSELLPCFADAINAKKQIVVVTKALDERRKNEYLHYVKCEQELSDIGVSIIHKKGMHEKLIFIDDSAVWIGSLNALSYSGLTGEVMLRHMSNDLAAEYRKLFFIDDICETVEKKYQQKCPICECEMLVKESDNGGIYWACVNEDYSRNADQQYPADGIMRCKCGAPFIFKMKNQPRWVCSNNSSHYQFIRESDLRLEKMQALITTKKERKEVELFFAKKRKERESAKAKPISNKKSSTSKKKSNSNRNSIKKPLNSENSSSNITNKMQVDQIRLF